MTLMVRKNGARWQKLEAIVFANEEQLQKLLHGSPELIPTKNEGAAAVFTREAGLPGSGFTDLIGADSEGNVLIVETKLARNGEIRRKVIGQVLEYAAYLWGMPFADFDRFFIKAEKQSVLDLLFEKDTTIDKEQLRVTLEENLRLGRFQLIIAVDAMNQELEKIIAYVSSRSSGLQLEALELELYKDGELEILVPQRTNQLNQPQEATSKRLLTFQEILNNCADEHDRELLVLLDSSWRAAGYSIKPGTVGASFQALIGTKAQPIFWAFPDLLQSNLSDLVKRGAPSDSVSQYRETLSSLEGFNREDMLAKSSPTTRLSD